MPSTHLTPSERSEIEALYRNGFSVTAIGQQLDRSKSTISRELRRNGSPGDRYKALNAQRRYIARRKPCRPAKKLNDARLRETVERALAQAFSPEQITARLVLEYPEEAGMRVSHETIYGHVYEDKRRGGTLFEGLRQRHRKRRNRSHAKDRRGIIKDRVLIHERPEIVEEQGRMGDWEGDTVIGKNHKGAIATFVDRKSLYLVAAPMPDKTPAALNAAAISAFACIPKRLRHTLTVDNGKEFTRFKELQIAIKTSVYFAEPYRSCQRAINENTNGLLRQFLPKKTSFEGLTQEQLDIYIDKLNNRPRKKLGYRTPAEVFHNLPVALRL